MRWDRDICRTVELTGAFSIWRNDARMRGKTGELLHHFDASGVCEDLPLTLTVRSELPLLDDPRLILCLTFSNSCHQKKLDFKCSLSQWIYWDGNLCPESALSCCCWIFFSLTSAERHSYPSVTGSSSVSGIVVFQFIPRPFQLERKHLWVHLKVALSVCPCASDTFLHKQEMWPAWVQLVWRLFLPTGGSNSCTSIKFHNPSFSYWQHPNSHPSNVKLCSEFSLKCRTDNWAIVYP